MFRNILWFFFLYFVNEVDKFTKRENLIIIKKLFSTRNNLNNPENSKKYEKYNPCVNLNGKFFYFDKNKTGFAFPNIIPIPSPSSVEISYNERSNLVINNYENFQKLIKMEKRFEIKAKNENNQLKADYLIKVNESKNQISFYE